MKEHVLSQPSLAAFEKDVVFASLDTEKTKSAAFLEKFPVEVWPTLFFIDPGTERVVLKWIGGVDLPQLEALLTATRGGAGVARDADEAVAKGNWGDAAEKYRAALDAGQKQPRTALALLSSLYLSRQSELCARTALDQLPLFTGAQERVVALGWGLGCALALPESPARTAALGLLVKEALPALEAPGVLPDDMSSLYEALVEERKAAKDDDGAVTLAKRWLAFLDAEAAKAATPKARAVFDPHRVSAALAAKTPEVMVEPLLRSEKELPGDYNPPARLALIYRELGRHPEALQAIDRALAKCTEGPRKLRLFETKASILEKQGDAKARAQTLEAAVRWAKKLPRAQVSQKRIEALEAQLAAAK
jgi:tetratricopeptide (TPR) repeat protein